LNQSTTVLKERWPWLLKIAVVMGCLAVELLTLSDNAPSQLTQRLSPPIAGPSLPSIAPELKALPEVELLQNTSKPDCVTKNKFYSGRVRPG
jgi:hypothetical protein